MPVTNAAGARLALADVSTTAVTDPEVVLAEDLYETERYNHFDPKPGGSLLKLLAPAGTVLRQSKLAALFPAPTVTGITPAEGPAAGGTVVTITGTHLDGITSVTFGGTVGTALTIVTDTELTVVAPAGVAGAVDVVVTDGVAPATEVGGFTYA